MCSWTCTADLKTTNFSAEMSWRLGLLSEMLQLPRSHPQSVWPGGLIRGTTRHK
jgi:hypothetical protein